MSLASTPRRDSNGRPCQRSRGRHGDDGFTLVEMLVTMAITLLVLALIPPILETVTNSASQSEEISAGTGQANVAIDNLTAQVGSAEQICLPTQLTAAGFTVRILQIVSTTNSGGILVTTYRWDQWVLNSTGQLEEEESATQTTTSASGIVWRQNSDGSPQWVTVVQPVVNSSSTPPFFLPNTTAQGSPQSLVIDLKVSEVHGRSTQLVELKSSVAALDTPYGSTTTTSTSSTSTSTTTTTVSPTATCPTAQPED